MFDQNASWIFRHAYMKCFIFLCIKQIIPGTGSQTLYFVFYEMRAKAEAPRLTNCSGDQERTISQIEETGVLSTTYIILHVCGGGRGRGLKTGNVIPLMHKVNFVHRKYGNSW